jgi:transcriptional regulator with XRE-family HTH domain
MQRDRNFGMLLRRWRLARGHSQGELALRANVSARHVSFLETGRALPSRDMVLQLAEALDVPLRERNALLVAGGHAAVYSELPIADAELATIRQMLQMILDRHEPFPAIVVDRRWNVTMHNAGMARMLGCFLAPAYLETTALNHARLVLRPDGLRPWIVNWPDVAAAMLNRLHREMAAAPSDAAKASLLHETLALPGIPEALRRPPPAAPISPFLPVRLRNEAIELGLFTTITSVGTPQDVTVQELRIEAFYPADAASERRLRELAGR